MKKKYWIFFIIVLLCAGVAVFAVICTSSKMKADSLSDASIKARFACDRITADVRETDAFCNPDFYRNTNISEEAYYKYMSCDNRLKTPATPEERASNLGGYSDGYETCADKNKFHAELLKYRQYLADLKEKTDKK